MYSTIVLPSLGLYFWCMYFDLYLPCQHQSPLTYYLPNFRLKYFWQFTTTNTSQDYSVTHQKLGSRKGPTGYFIIPRSQSLRFKIWPTCLVYRLIEFIYSYHFKTWVFICVYKIMRIQFSIIIHPPEIWLDFWDGLPLRKKKKSSGLWGVPWSHSGKKNTFSEATRGSKQCHGW